MANSKVKYSFVSLVFIILIIPSFSHLGVKDVGSLFGVDDGKPFFMRNTAVRASNQIYEWMNLGLFHSGYSRNIKSLADGALVEEGYLNVYLTPMIYNETSNTDVLKRISNIAKTLNRRGTKTILVLAPDKLSLYPSSLPWHTKLLWGNKRDYPPHPEFMKALNKHNIRGFNAYSFLQKERKNYTENMFPYAGTHWNALASSLVLEQILTELGFNVNHFIGVKESEEVIFADNDMGGLLNMFHNPFLKKNKSYIPIFSDSDSISNEGSVLFFGDSFVGQIATSCSIAKNFSLDKIVMCDKRACTDDEIKLLSKDIKLLVFVYQPPFFMSLQSTLGKYIETLELQLQQLTNNR